MNFEFSEEQKMLREQALGFLQDKSPLSVVRRVLESPDEAYDQALWRQMAELGWHGVAIPEKHGGLGLGHLELCVIAEELGRSLAPVPFSSSVYMATEALLLAGTAEQQEKWLPKLASGDAIGTFALPESHGRATPASLASRATGGKITGTKLAVPDAGQADFAVVVVGAAGGDGAQWQLVELDQDGVERTPVQMIDPSRAHANIVFNGADAEPMDGAERGWALTQQLLDRAAVLFAWEQVGGSDAALEMAKQYALGRFAFGRAIASYQAIKHKLANMYVKTQLARSNCYYGAWALDTNAGELPLAAATSRVSATQAYYFASKENIQTHGGMGFTWEFDCQFYYRRAKLLSVNLGGEGTWQDRLIDAHIAQSAA